MSIVPPPASTIITVDPFYMVVSFITGDCRPNATNLDRSRGHAKADTILHAGLTFGDEMHSSTPGGIVWDNTSLHSRFTHLALL